MVSRGLRYGLKGVLDIPSFRSILWWLLSATFLFLNLCCFALFLLCSVVYHSLSPKILGINGLTVHSLKWSMPVIWLLVLRYRLLYRVLSMVVEVAT